MSSKKKGQDKNKKNRESSKKAVKLSDDKSSQQNILDYAIDQLKMDKTKAEKYIRAFEKLDKDSSGEITIEEFRIALDRLNFGTTWTHAQVQEVYSKIDSDKSGKINAQDFLNVLNQEHPDKELMTLVNTILHEQTPKGNPNQLADYEETEEEKKNERATESWQSKERRFEELGPERYAIEILEIPKARFKKHMDVYRLLDIDDNGTISLKELDTIMNKYSIGEDLSRHDVENIFKEIDEDGSGSISMLEYLENLAKEHSMKELLGIIEQIYEKRSEILAGYQEQGKKRDMRFYNSEKSLNSSPAKIKALEPNQKATNFEKMGPQNYAIEVLGISESRYYKFMDVFRLLDVDDDGSISKKELDSIMNTYSIGMSLTREDVKKFFKEIDEDNSGSISKFEYLESLGKGHANKELLGIIETINAKKKEILQGYHKAGKKKDLKFSSSSSLSSSPAKSQSKSNEGGSGHEVISVKSGAMEAPKKKALPAISNSERQISDDAYEEMFNLLDLNGDQSIDRKELDSALKTYKCPIQIPQEEINNAYRRQNEKDVVNPINLMDFHTFVENPASKLGAFFKMVIKQNLRSLEAVSKYAPDEEQEMQNNSEIQSQNEDIHLWASFKNNLIKNIERDDGLASKPRDQLLKAIESIFREETPLKVAKLSMFELLNDILTINLQQQDEQTNQIEQLKAVLKQAEKKEADFTAEVEKLKTTLQESTSSISDLRTKIEDQLKTIEKLTEENELYRQNEGKINEAKDVVTKSLNELTSINEGINKENLSIKQQLDQIEKKYDLEGQNKSLDQGPRENERDQELKELREKIHSLEEELKKAIEEINSKSIQIKAFEEEKEHIILLQKTDKENLSVQEKIKLFNNPKRQEGSPSSDSKQGSRQKREGQLEEHTDDQTEIDLNAEEKRVNNELRLKIESLEKDKEEFEKTKLLITDQRDSLTDQVKSLNEQYENEHNNYKILTTKKNEVEQQLTELRNELLAAKKKEEEMIDRQLLITAEHERDALAQEVKRLHEKLEEATSTEKQLREHEHNFIEEKAIIQQKLNELEVDLPTKVSKEDYNKLELENKALTEQRDKLSYELKENDICIKNVQEKDDELKEIKIKHEAEIVDLNKRIEDMVSKKDYSDLQDQREAVINERITLEEKLLAAHSHEANLSNRIQELEASLKKSEDLLAQSEKKITEMVTSEEHNKVKLERDSSEKQNIELKEQNESNNTRIKELEKSKDELEHQRSELQKQMQDLLSKDKSTGDAAQILTAQIQELQGKITSLEGERRTLEDENNQIKTEKKQLELEIKQKQDEIASMVAQAEYEKLKLDKQHLENKVKELDEALSHAQTSQKDIEAKKEEVENSKAHLDHQLKELEIRLKDMVAVEEFNKLKIDLEALVQSNEFIKKEKEEVDSKLKEAEDKNASLQTELAQIKEDLLSLQTAEQDMVSKIEHNKALEQISSLKITTETLRGDLEASQSDGQDIKVKKEELEVKIDQVSLDLLEARKKLEDSISKHEYNNVVLEKETLLEERKQLDRKIEEVQSHSKIFEDERENIHKEVEQLRLESLELRKREIDMVDKERYDTDVKEYKNQIEELREEIAKLKEKKTEENTIRLNPVQFKAGEEEDDVNQDYENEQLKPLREEILRLEGLMHEAKKELELEKAANNCLSEEKQKALLENEYLKREIARLKGGLKAKQPISVVKESDEDQEVDQIDDNADPANIHEDLDVEQNDEMAKIKAEKDEFKRQAYLLADKLTKVQQQRPDSQLHDEGSHRSNLEVEDVFETLNIEISAMKNHNETFHKIVKESTEEVTAEKYMHLFDYNIEQSEKVAQALEQGKRLFKNYVKKQNQILASSIKKSESVDQMGTSSHNKTLENVVSALSGRSQQGVRVTRGGIHIDSNAEEADIQAQNSGSPDQAGLQIRAFTVSDSPDKAQNEAESTPRNINTVKFTLETIEFLSKYLQSFISETKEMQSKEAEQNISINISPKNDTQGQKPASGLEPGTNEVFDAFLQHFQKTAGREVMQIIKDREQLRIENATLLRRLERIKYDDRDDNDNEVMDTPLTVKTNNSKEIRFDTQENTDPKPSSISYFDDDLASIGNIDSPEKKKKVITSKLKIADSRGNFEGLDQDEKDDDGSSVESQEKRTKVSLLTELLERNGQIEELTTQNGELNKQIIDLTEEVQKTKQFTDDVKKRKIEEVKSSTLRTESMKDAVLKMTKAAELSEKLNSENIELRETLSGLTKQNEELKEINDTRAEKIASLEKEKEEVTQKLQQELDQLKSEHSELLEKEKVRNNDHTENVELHHTFVTLTKQNEELRVAADAKSEKITNLEKEKEEAIKPLQQELDKLKEEHSKARKINDLKEEELKREKVRNEEHLAKIVALTEEAHHNHLNVTRVKILEAEKQDIEKLLADMTEKNKNLQMEVNSNKENASRINILEAEKKQMEKLISDLSNNNERLVQIDVHKKPIKEKPKGAIPQDEDDEIENNKSILADRSAVKESKLLPTTEVSDLLNKNVKDIKVMFDQFIQIVKDVGGSPSKGDIREIMGEMIPELSQKIYEKLSASLMENESLQSPVRSNASYEKGHYRKFSGVSKMSMTPNVDDKFKWSHRSSYQILNWTADNFAVTAYLLPLCERSKREEFKHESEKINKEIVSLSTEVTEYFRNMQSEGFDSFLIPLKYIIDLINKCYNKQGRMKAIQHRMTSHIKERLDHKKRQK